MTHNVAGTTAIKRFTILSPQLDAAKVIAVARNPGVEGAHKPAAAHKTPTHKTQVAVAVYIQARIVGLPAS
jgi:hypothetical protein